MNEEILELITDAEQVEISAEPTSGRFNGNRNDTDVYEFTIGEGEIINFTPISDTTVPLEIYDANGNLVVGENLLGRSPNAGGEIALGDVPAGTYFLVANNQGLGSFFSGSYEIQTARVVDSVGNNINTASSIEPNGETIAVALDLRDDVDVYALEVAEGQILNFDLALSNSGNVFTLLLDADGNQLSLITRGSDFIYEADFSGTIFVSFELGRVGGPQNGLEVTSFELTITNETPEITVPSLETIIGTRGRDNLQGTSGDDFINGLRGADELFGGNGADTILGGNGADMIFGQNGADRIEGQNGKDIIDGGAGADELFGGKGADTILGGNGADMIFGQNGADAIAGGNGADTITGGAGNDYLSGDVGADTFVFLEGSGFDTITDFEVGRDQIDLSDFNFNNFNELNLVEQNNSVFIFIDENTSIELSNIEYVEDLSANDFIF